MIHISHKSVRSDEILSNNINITAEVIDYAGYDLESVKVHWKYSTEDGPYSQFNLEFESDDIYSGLFPEINLNSEIEYFIIVTNSSENSVSHPNTGWHNFILNNLIGDVNSDNFINIQDVILLINYILSDSYNEAGDLNLDGQLNVLDIIELVNLILEN